MMHLTFRGRSDHFYKKINSKYMAAKKKAAAKKAAPKKKVAAKKKKA